MSDIPLTSSFASMKFRVFSLNFNLRCRYSNRGASWLMFINRPLDRGRGRGAGSTKAGSECSFFPQRNHFFFEFECGCWRTDTVLTKRISFSILVLLLMTSYFSNIFFFNVLLRDYSLMPVKVLLMYFFIYLLTVYGTRPSEWMIKIE